MKSSIALNLRGYLEIVGEGGKGYQEMHSQKTRSETSQKEQ